MSKKLKKNLIRILVTAALLVILHFVPTKGLSGLFLYLIPYAIISYDILRKAWKGIINRQPLDENLLMAIATIGALVLAIAGRGDYTEAIAVMLFYQIGEWFQGYAVGKSRRSISELMDIRPDYANIEQGGELVKVDPDEVEPGTVIIVQPGEKIPIDGIIEEGSSSLDCAALTGESLPRDVSAGMDVVSGCINLSGVLKIRTTKDFGESTVSKILDLVENASSAKSKSEDFITKFARIYTPVVVGSAVLLALVPPLVRMAMSLSPEWGDWIYRALTFLVISCPCALVISIPLTFFAGLGGASRQGILIKGSNYLEALSKTDCVVFDKTGTLTQGVFEVTKIEPAGSFGENELLKLAAHAECASSHPISLSLQKACEERCKGVVDRTLVSEISEQSGHGVSAVVEGKKVAAGNERLMRSLGIAPAEVKETGTIVHVAVDGQYAGYIVISDKLRESSAEAIKALRSCGVRRTVMLTGDAGSVAKDVAAQLGIDEVHSELLPGNKVEMVEKLLSERGSSGTLAFAGDGINDAPVLTRADVGIAMGAMGSDAAIEAADIVLMHDDPMGISKAIRIARKCMRIVYENIWFAIGIKLICLILGALGLASMWLAIFADVGVMILAVLNAMRALFAK